MSVGKAFAKHFGMLVAYASIAILLMLFLVFGVLMPFFTQLFGEIVYIQPENVWVFGLIAILFTFAFSFMMNYFYAKKMGGVAIRAG